MRHVKKYKELFEAQTELTPEQIEWLDECTSGSWTLNPQTGLVDVNGDLYCDHQSLPDFKGVRFGVVVGDFDCSNNQLTSLKGAPQSVRDFACPNNQITSLEGSPQSVRDFACFNNQLTSLKGAPQSVRDFACPNNQLTSLEGAPQSVRNFDCRDNKLTSLEGAPQRVEGYFDCSNNQLTSLKGAPKNVRMSLYCYDNPVSESVLKALYKKMQSGMSWSDAVAEEWDYSIESEEDKILLAPHNLNLSPEDAKGYQALARLRKRIL
jgi:hypothetical protein